MSEEEKCPNCGCELDYDEVDIGVGIQRGPARCTNQDCGYDASKAVDEMLGNIGALDPEKEKRRIWYTDRYWDFVKGLLNPGEILLDLFPSVWDMHTIAFIYQSGKKKYFRTILEPDRALAYSMFKILEVMS